MNITTPNGKSFTSERIIGKGTQGTAYLVKDKKGFKFVLKEISLTNSLVKQQAIREIEAMRESCQHENIINYYESFSLNRYLYIVMEYAHNSSLDKIIQEHASRSEYFSQAQIVHYMSEISAALNYCHSKKMIHRDVKPGNILLTQVGKIKLTDFGLAKTLAVEEICQTFLGTPLYMCPEVLKGMSYSYKADIWSCGVVMYELMALDAPWFLLGNKPSSIPDLKNIIINNSPNFSLLETLGYKKNLVKVVKWMLHKNQNKRATANDILESIEVKSPPTFTETITDPTQNYGLPKISNNYLFDKKTNYIKKYTSNEESAALCIQNSLRNSLKYKEKEVCVPGRYYTKYEEEKITHIQNVLRKSLRRRNDNRISDFKKFNPPNYIPPNVPKMVPISKDGVSKKVDSNDLPSIHKNKQIYATPIYGNNLKDKNLNNRSYKQLLDEKHKESKLPKPPSREKFVNLNPRIEALATPRNISKPQYYDRKDTRPPWSGGKYK